MTGSPAPLGKAQQPIQLRNLSDKGCRNDALNYFNIETRVKLEEERLKLLQFSLTCKRPVQSLRLKGLNGLDKKTAHLIIQEAETKATFIAIEMKKARLKQLRAILNERRQQNPNYKLAINKRLVHLTRKKFAKKLNYFKQCDEDVWADWNKKNIVTSTGTYADYERARLNKKEKRKLRSKKRKCSKKKQLLIERADMAIKQNLVINLSDVEIPKYSIAILSYGQGWIPCPDFDQLRFKIDCLNAANKQSWAAIFKDSDSNINIPIELLKNEITPSCNEFFDPVIKQVKNEIVEFSNNVNVMKPKRNLNRFEKEGLFWLRQAIKDEKIAITSADKGGAILVLNPSQIRATTEEKLTDISRYVNIGLENPLPNLKRNLNEVWIEGFNKGYVTKDELNKTMGLFFQKRKGNPQHS